MPKSKREKTAKELENTILEYLKLKEEPVKFYNLYKDLNLTSGGAQTAIKRMQKKEKGKIFIKKRVRRFENFIWYKDFDIESPIIDLNGCISPVFAYLTDSYSFSLRYSIIVELSETTSSAESCNIVVNFS